MTTQKKVLDQLNSGEISFTEASHLLGIPKEEIEKLLDEHDWLPSIERITELCDKEKETIAYIKKLNPPQHKSKKAKSYYTLSSINFKNTIKIPCVNVLSDLLVNCIPTAMSINNSVTTFGNQYVAYRSEGGFEWN